MVSYPGRDEDGNIVLLLFAAALLVSELTQTELPANIRQMVRTSLVPFAITCAAYLLLGRTNLNPAAAAETVSALFQSHYELSALTLLPVIAVLLLIGLNGFQPTDPALAALMGGGIISMMSVFCIVCLPVMPAYSMEPAFWRTCSGKFINWPRASPTSAQQL